MLNERERNLAAMMHLGTIFAPIIAPLAALFLVRDSSFVQAHAKRSLKETLVLQALLLVLGVISLVHSAVTLWNFYQANWEGFSIWPIVTKIALIWVGLLLLQVINVVQSLRAAANALKGRWPGSRRALA